MLGQLPLPRGAPGLEESLRLHRPLLRPETKLYNAKARYFDPKLGRLLTQDFFLGNHDNPPSLHRYAYGFNNPLVFIDPDGNESVRQAWGLDEPQGFWSAFGKNVAYNAWNVISFGTLGRQDTLVEQYEAGQISDEQYWGRAAINAGSSAVAPLRRAPRPCLFGCRSGAAAGTTASAAPDRAPSMRAQRPRRPPSALAPAPASAPGCQYGSRHVMRPAGRTAGAGVSSTSREAKSRHDVSFYVMSCRLGPLKCRPTS